MNEKDTALNIANDNIVDINLDAVKRKKFRIDKDNNRILELDTTDLSIIDRFRKKYNEMLTVVDNAFSELSETDSSAIEDINDDRVDMVINSISDVDTKMRAIINDIFNSNVSEVCAPFGSMLDPINGKFRFEHIIDTLLPLYEHDISAEMGKINSRVHKHTSKYIK